MNLKKNTKAPKLHKTIKEETNIDNLEVFLEKTIKRYVHKRLKLLIELSVENIVDSLNMKSFNKEIDLAPTDDTTEDKINKETEEFLEKLKNSPIIPPEAADKSPFTDYLYKYPGSSRESPKDPSKNK